MRYREILTGCWMFDEFDEFDETTEVVARRWPTSSEAM